jgi:hypothetical protein
LVKNGEVFLRPLYPCIVTIDVQSVVAGHSTDLEVIIITPCADRAVTVSV